MITTTYVFWCNLIKRKWNMQIIIPHYESNDGLLSCFKLLGDGYIDILIAE